MAKTDAEAVFLDTNVLIVATTLEHGVHTLSTLNPSDFGPFQELNLLSPEETLHTRSLARGI